MNHDRAMMAGDQKEPTSLGSIRRRGNVLP
jgi:hypothetical protein